MATPHLSAAELRRDAWRTKNVSKSSSPGGCLQSSSGVPIVGELGNSLHSSRPASDGALIPGEVWPTIEQGIRQGRGAQQRLTLAPNQHRDWIVDSSGYHPTTHGGERHVRLQIVADIKCHLFCEESTVHLGELAEACDRLQASMDRMLALGLEDHGDRPELIVHRVAGPPMADCSAVPSMDRKVPEYSVLQVGDDKWVHNLGQDPCFDHSWATDGPDPGWYWIPKGRLTLDICHPARPVDRHRFSSRKVRALPPNKTLTKSFAQATRMARPPGKRRQEEWMEEDDLLGGEMQAQDLRRQLQRGGGRGPGTEGGGFRGRRLDQYDGQGQFQDGHERFGGNRQYNPRRNQPQQGGWNNSLQGAWNYNSQGIWASNQQATGNRPGPRFSEP